ncbi:MAG: thiamine diphosphokinase [Acidimicrobiia bacterium]|nr:thiamine diphosphokinase [Acidimicrobiia bacterium]MDH3397054.1 thiamine diphosphokinase [Acidimicrobiia bacterium]
MSDTVIVFAGGDPIPPSAVADLPADAFVVAADSGLDRARESGFKIDLLVGDLDSISSDGRQDAEAHGTKIERHPVDKDATDMELALEAARRHGARHVIVIGGYGGRQDHYLANALLLPSPTFADLDIEWRAGRTRLFAVHHALELAGEIGALISLLAVGGAVRGVETQGLRWNLAGDDLEPGSTRGVSNEFRAERASITVEAGTLLVVVPDPEAP